MKKVLLLLVLLCSPALAQNPGVTTQGSVTANNCVKFVNRNLIADAGAACGGGGGGTPANPTAVVGLTTVNGVLATYMRSDAAPPLDQTAAFKFTGLDDTVIAAGKSLTVDTNAGVPTLYVDPTNHRVGFKKAAPAYVIDAHTQSRFTGSSGLVGAIDDPSYGISLQNNANSVWLEILNNGGAGKGAFFGLTTGNSFQIWNYQGGDIKFFTGTSASSGLEHLTLSNTGALKLTQTGGVTLTNPAADTLQFGPADVASGAAAQVLRAQSNTGASTTGPDFTIQGTTGTTSGGSLLFQTATTTGNATAMQISPAHFVGIGRAPGYILDVAGQSRITNAGSTPVAIGDTTYALSLQSGNASTWLEILNSGGTGKGVFFGITSNSFQLWNYQGGDIGFYTGTAAGSSSERLNISTTGALKLTQTGGVTFTNPAAATLQLGAANAAVPVNQTAQAQGSRSGTDTNVSGSNFTVASGQGTGNSVGSSLVLQSPVAVASGTGAQTMTTGLSINGGTAITTGYAVAALPATATAGARAHVTDALNAAACVFFGAIVAGGTTVCPVFYNGAAWVGG